jgi:phosphoserine aminotransferase
MKTYNFSAGPAILPEAVMKTAQHELLDWHQSHMSIIEMSHRGSQFTQVAQASERCLRELMNIPDEYKVLFLQGGATTQFSAIPLNLMGLTGEADYIHTGVWSEKAIKEAQRYGQVNVIADMLPNAYTDCPAQSALKFTPNASYVHYTPNETIGGVEFDYIPDTQGIPLVADFSSTLLSRPIDVSKFGVIYAGAQKNIGPSGLCLVIVKESLLGHAHPLTPTLLNWDVQAKNDSMYNTPATFSWYMAGLVFQWLKDLGGLAKMAEINQRKSAKLYRAIDQSAGFYSNPVNPSVRSWMNVPFFMATRELDSAFLAQATQAGLLSLKGHKIAGGMRASLYNAMPEEGVDALIDFMQSFHMQHL